MRVTPPILFASLGCCALLVRGSNTSSFSLGTLANHSTFFRVLAVLIRARDASLDRIDFALSLLFASFSFLALGILVATHTNRRKHQYKSESK
jgi:hypothetical protein